MDGIGFMDKLATIIMTPEIEIFIDKYVVPYRREQNKRKDIINQLRLDSDCTEIIKVLLTCKGWRERAFAATAIGALKLEQFVDQIYQQAIPLDEYHAAQQYAFALTIINTPKTIKYLQDLATKETSNKYSENVRNNYLAALAIVFDLTLNDVMILQIKNHIQSHINLWRSEIA